VPTGNRVLGALLHPWKKGYVWNRWVYRPQEVVTLILDGVKRLEYRGYDSAGVAVVTHNGQLEIRRAPDKLCNLEEAVPQRFRQGQI